MSNFDDDFSFVEIEDTCSYDGDSDDSNDNFDNEDFLFPSNVENTFLSAELSNIVCSSSDESNESHQAHQKPLWDPING